MGSLKRSTPWNCVQRVIDSCDVIIEVIDARFPKETRSTDLEWMVKRAGKRLILMLNKADLVPRESRIALRESMGYEHPVILFSVKMRWLREKSMLFRMILLLVRTKDGVPVRAGVVGYPNTGKSSVINFLTNRHAAKTSPISQFTRGIQWINCAGRFRGRVSFMDTPGVIPLVKRAPEMEEGLVLTGAISPERAAEPILAAEAAISRMLAANPKSFLKHSDLAEYVPEASPAEVLEMIGRRRGKLLKGGVVDLNECAKIVLRDWQSGKLRET